MSHSTPSPATTVLVPETPRTPLSNHNATSNETELNRLRETRHMLTADLEDSTARNQRLLVRAQVERANADAARAQLGGFKDEIQAEARARRRWEGVVVAMVVLVLVYACWCVYAAPEMGYVRKRRAELLGL